ncbi:274_t:CDS:2 [Dentiscutata erythropus]|uniref:274_t:CDS:1 n=1 Tax=Dentiscutata erythropus TaxID=1348616 RepID=A0A9N9G0A6_9GLOM|nr:274_t:CDS:2 [Dentiscutata erythropus]
MYINKRCVMFNKEFDWDAERHKFSTVFEDIDIIVEIDDVGVLVKLDTKSYLYEVRMKLERNNIIEITNVIHFTKNDVLISLDDESTYKLNDILDGNKIFLMKNPRPNWQVLVRKFKLEYGRNYDEDKDKVAGKKAFIIENCEFSVLEPIELNFHTLISSSVNDLSRNKNLFLKAQLDIPNIANLGVSIEPKNIQQNKSKETSLKFELKNIVKANLSITRIVPTREFNDAVEKAFHSKDPNMLQKIIEEFGQFIPTVILFGGRLHYMNTAYTEKNSENNKKAFSGNLSVYGQGLEAQYKPDVTNRNENTIQFQDSVIFGGDKIKILQGKENDWIFSLEDFKYWEIIEFHKPVSIFEFLDDDKIRKLNVLKGKMIIYSNVQFYNFKMHDRNNGSDVVDLKMPQNIGSILSNRDIDLQVFSAVSSTEEDDTIFTCVLYTPPPSYIPKVIINCIQSDYEQKKEYQLKISWFVVGYDLNFNSVFDPTHCLQSVKIKLCYDYDSEFSLEASEVLKIPMMHSTVLYCIPVVSEWDDSFKYSIIGHHFNRHDDKVRVHLYGYDLRKKECLRSSALRNFNLNILYPSSHPNSDIFNYFRIERNSSVKKMSLTKMIKNVRKNTSNTSSKLSGLISLYTEGYEKLDHAFIGKKHGRFFIMNPDKPIPQYDHFSVAVFDPEIED